MFYIYIKMRFVYLKRIWATFVAFPEIQDGGQEEIMSGKFEFRFTEESYRFILAILHFCDA